MEKFLDFLNGPDCDAEGDDLLSFFVEPKLRDAVQQVSELRAASDSTAATHILCQQWTPSSATTTTTGGSVQETTAMQHDSQSGRLQEVNPASYHGAQHQEQHQSYVHQAVAGSHPPAFQQKPFLDMHWEQSSMPGAHPQLQHQVDAHASSDRLSVDLGSRSSWPLSSLQRAPGSVAPPMPSPFVLQAFSNSSGPLSNPLPSSHQPPLSSPLPFSNQPPLSNQLGQASSNSFMNASNNSCLNALSDPPLSARASAPVFRGRKPACSPMDYVHEYPNGAAYMMPEDASPPSQQSQMACPDVEQYTVERTAGAQIFMRQAQSMFQPSYPALGLTYQPGPDPKKLKNREFQRKYRQKHRGELQALQQLVEDQAADLKKRDAAIAGLETAKRVVENHNRMLLLRVKELEAAMAATP